MKPQARQIAFALSLSLLLTGLDMQTTPADQFEPYIAYVARESEFTRCGPGKNFYKTDPLKAGQEIEVYLETADDWLGIRPPDNSFCWIQSDQIQVDENDTTGRVVDSAAQSWIGTNLGKAENYRWQVRLDIGEKVTIIGTAKRDGPDGDEFWYQIVPPSGEFRWVHRSQIVDSPEDVDFSSLKKTTGSFAAKQKQVRPSEEARSSLPDTDTDTELTHSVLDDSPIGSGVADSKRPLPPVSSEDLRETNLSRSEIRTVAYTESESMESPVPIRKAYQIPEKLESANVEILRMELTRAMAAGATSVEIDPLRIQCEVIASRSSDSVDRGRAALLLNEIREFQRVAARRGKSIDNQALVASGLPIKSDPTGIADGTGAETKFDQRGWLVKVYSSRPNTPPYAITDSADRTISYITPVAGINLTRYLNQEIGLYGRVAHDTSLETPHLIAEQVVRLRR